MGFLRMYKSDVQPAAPTFEEPQPLQGETSFTLSHASATVKLRPSYNGPEEQILQISISIRRNNLNIESR